MIWNSETFHDNLFFMIAIAAIAKIHIYYKYVHFFEYHQIQFLSKAVDVVMINQRACEKLTPFYNNLKMME